MRNKKLSPILFKKQYIGHARHVGPYKENTLALYLYLVDILKYNIIECDVVFTADNVPVLNHGIYKKMYKNGRGFQISIPNHTIKEVKSFSLYKNRTTCLTTVEELIQFAHKRNICVMLDLTFQKYSFTQLKALHSLVCKYKMKKQTIWGDANIFKLALLDHHLIYQVGGSWGRKMLLETFFKSLFCRQIIMSFSYYGGNISSFRKIVYFGHKMGFLMKVATINEERLANCFWNIGTDLINTDTLLNKE